MKTLNIIGAGRLGKVLARLWADSQTFVIQSIYNRSERAAQQSVQFIGQGTPCCEFAEIKSADLTLIATPDDTLAEVGIKLLGLGKTPSNCLVFHCSGALSSEIFKPLQQAGCHVASAHPIASFADTQLLLSTFKDTYCAIEADSEIETVLTDAFSAIGARCFPLASSQKMLYHSATVMAINHLVGLVESAKQLYLAAGVNEELCMKLLRQVMPQTLSNVFKLGTTSALTGPVARGDVNTVMAHCQALENLPVHLNIYKDISALLTQLAKQQNPTQQEKLDEIQSVVSSQT